MKECSVMLYIRPCSDCGSLPIKISANPIIPVFYAESVGLSLGAIGVMLFWVRLFDAVNDPILGWLSDRFRPSIGRRRLWFAASVPLIMLGVWNLFWPPIEADIFHMGLWTLVLSIGYTCAILPYSAWGAELETNYYGRARLSAMREGFTLAGVLLAISIPFSIGWSEPGSVHGFAVLAIIIVVALPFAAIVALITVPEPKEYSNQHVRFFDGLRYIRNNRPFIRLIGAFFLNGFANSIAATLFLFYCSQRLGLENERGGLIFLYFLCGIAGVPFWTRVASKGSKHRAWCMAMVFAATVFSPTPFLPHGSLMAFGAICVLSGFALGADLALPAAIQADVIDVDTARSGEQRTASYFALWGLATKLSLALTVVIVLPLLEWYGFSANQAVPSTAIGVALLGFIYGWGPIALKLPAIAMMWKFPLGPGDIASLRTQIETRIE